MYKDPLVVKELVCSTCLLVSHTILEHVRRVT